MRTACAVAVAAMSGLGLWDSAYAQVPASVQLSYSETVGSTVSIGSTFKISVLCGVVNPAGANDGIFVFSQNFLETNTVLGAATPFAILSVSQTGDSDFVSSTGTAATDGSGYVIGENGIYGGYDASTVGVGSAAAIYTVTLQAIAPGSATFTTSPSSAEYFTNQTADGFMLYQSGTPTGNYPAGPTIQAVAVPEPASAGIAAGLMALLGRRRSTHQRRRMSWSKQPWSKRWM